MGWVRHSEPAGHQCAPPTREVVYALPTRLTEGATTEHCEDAPAGASGDLWRCECRALWRVGQACEACDMHGRRGDMCPRGGWHATGMAWRPARWWQRLMYHGGR